MYFKTWASKKTTVRLSLDQWPKPEIQIQPLDVSSLLARSLRRDAQMCLSASPYLPVCGRHSNTPRNFMDFYEMFNGL